MVLHCLIWPNTSEVTWFYSVTAYIEVSYARSWNRVLQHEFGFWCLVSLVHVVVCKLSIQTLLQKKNFRSFSNSVNANSSCCLNACGWSSASLSCLHMMHSGGKSTRVAFLQHSWLQEDALGVWSTAHAAHTRPSSTHFCFKLDFSPQ